MRAEKLMKRLKNFLVLATLAPLIWRKI